MSPEATALRIGRALLRAAPDAPTAGRARPLTGAEAVAAVLAAAGVQQVFAYPGTSELALCDAVDRTGRTRLVNGRGDKESAFLAAGASLLHPARGAAILHGARGLTNAGGAVADARRNEVGTLLLVGLPSTGSARFLPPHGERGLRSGMSAFVDWWWESSAVPGPPADRAQAAHQYVSQLRSALAFVAQPPHRPAVFAVPQDVAEQRWIPLAALAARMGTGPSSDPPAGTRSAGGAHAETARAVTARAVTARAVTALRESRRPAFLVDDYALRYPGMRRELDRLSRAVGAPVLQVKYRRGPMLFERLRTEEVGHFVGWLNQFSAVHRGLLDSCDLLVTVEDRNIYPRVVGRLPSCPKVAVNSDPHKVRKNEYLSADDALVVGNPATVLADLADSLGASDPVTPWFPPEAGGEDRVNPEPPAAPVANARRAVAAAIGGCLGRWQRPVLVDDSQMFGGLLAEEYDVLPVGLRVFGGHGGFVGGGLAYAVGLAVAHPDVRVMCTLGDQAFTNSFQGLAAAIQERAPVLFVVCNNGQSVSLMKQAAASYGRAERQYLANVPGFRYCAVAEALGVPTAAVEVPIGGPHDAVTAAVDQLAAVLDKAAGVEGPSLVELVLPSDPTAWRGIWLTRGFEQREPVTAA